jgi:AbrB family looped-hinge helix DNA binding protein
MQCQAKVDSRGRITLPSEIRRLLTVQPGDKVLFENCNNGIRVRAVRTESPFAPYKGIGNPDIGPGRQAVVRRTRKLRSK